MPEKPIPSGLMPITLHKEELRAIQRTVDDAMAEVQAAAKRINALDAAINANLKHLQNAKDTFVNMRERALYHMNENPDDSFAPWIRTVAQQRRDALARALTSFTQARAAAQSALTSKDE